jgi:hypothetical protein
MPLIVGSLRVTDYLTPVINHCGVATGTPECSQVPHLSTREEEGMMLSVSSFRIADDLAKLIYASSNTAPST